MKTYTPNNFRKNIFEIINGNNAIRVSMKNKYHDNKHDWIFTPMKELNLFKVWQERRGLHNLIHKAENMTPENEKDFMK